MHPNPTYRSTDSTRSLDFARRRGFGILALNGDEGMPMMAHVPFLISSDGQSALLHLVRSNPIARVLNTGARPARIAVSGPDGYVSPDWYGAEDQVPTWNYVAVHLSGEISVLPQEALLGLLDAESDFFEEMLAPKAAWKTAKMSPETLDRMMRQIIPCQFTIAKTDATWKLNQNKPDAVRLRAAKAMAESPVGQDTAALAGLMRSVAED